MPRASRGPRRIAISTHRKRSASSSSRERSSARSKRWLWIRRPRTSGHASMHHRCGGEGCVRRGGRSVRGSGSTTTPGCATLTRGCVRGRVNWIDRTISPLPAAACESLRLALAPAIGPDPVTMPKDVAGLDAERTRRVLKARAEMGGARHASRRRAARQQVEGKSPQAG